MNDVLANQNMSSPSDSTTPTTSRPEESGSVRSLIVYTIVALSLALFIRFFIAAPYVVSGASMVPTFYDYHYLIVDRVTYDFGEPTRGDVIVFKLPQGQERALIKRVIGLPGETVVLEGNKVSIINTTHPDGFTIDEPYLDPQNLGGASNMRVTLTDDQYFVLGDNRRVSADSRSWGVLPKENIVGRAVLRLFPFTQLDIFPGQVRYDQDSSITNTNS